LYLRRRRSERLLTGISLSSGAASSSSSQGSVFYKSYKRLDWLATNTDVIATQSRSLFTCSREKNHQVENGLYSRKESRNLPMTHDTKH
jgi:hypothetical protein